MLLEKINNIKDLESKLELKNKECIQLKATQIKSSETVENRKNFSRDLRECIKNQELKLSGLFNTGTLDLFSLSKNPSNLRKNEITE